eukprot:6757945-Pyramimonas_sp.AAC.1
MATCPGLTGIRWPPHSRSFCLENVRWGKRLRPFPRLMRRVCLTLCPGMRLALARTGGIQWSWR